MELLFRRKFLTQRKRRGKRSKSTLIKLQMMMRSCRPYQHLDYWICGSFNFLSFYSEQVTSITLLRHSYRGNIWPILLISYISCCLGDLRGITVSATDSRHLSLCAFFPPQVVLNTSPLHSMMFSAHLLLCLSLSLHYSLQVTLHVSVLEKKIKGEGCCKLHMC